MFKHIFFDYAHASINLHTGLLSKLQLCPSRSSSPGIDLLQAPSLVSTKRSWPDGGAPFCFPFSGRCYHNGTLAQYSFEQAIYPMPMHGFGHLFPWTLLEDNDDSAKLRLTSSEETRVFFPFDFTIIVTYRLTNPHQLSISLSVQNNGQGKQDSQPETQPMPLYLGFHPFFSCSSFNINEAKVFIPAEDYHAVNAQGLAESPNKSLQDVYSLHDPRIMSGIFTKITDNRLSLMDKQKRLDLCFMPQSDFNAVVTYKPATEPGILCLEPWMALPNAINTDRQGMRFLKIHERLQQEYRITLSSLLS